MAFMSVTGTCISFCIIRFEHYQPTRFRLVFSCTLSFFQYTVIVTSSEQIVIDITKSHPTKTRKPCVTFLPNVPNAAKSSNRPGRRKTKEEKTQMRCHSMSRMPRGRRYQNLQMFHSTCQRRGMTSTL